MVYWDLFVAFLRVGVFGYGGGPSLIPLVQEEVVNRYHWMTNEEFLDALAMGNALPGPIVTKMSTYVGYKVASYPGAVVATAAVIFPTAIAMVLLFELYRKFKDTPQMAGMLKAVRPVVVVLLALVAYDMAKASFPGWVTVVIAGIAIIALGYLNIHPAIVIVAAMVFGFFFLS
ncbi:MAG: chromate transporter [Thermincolia bacterium]